MDDVDGDELPGAIAEAYLERERGIRGLLDELETLGVEGDYEQLRERIRAFADAERAAFFAVALALTDSPQFFGEVEAQLGVEPADALRDLADTHATLAEPFGIVRVEIAEDRRNPVTGLDVTTSYDPEASVPLVGYTARSGRLPLYESRGPPEAILGTATHLVQATNDALAASVEENHPVGTDPLSELIDRREELESELTALQDRIDELRRAPADE